MSTSIQDLYIPPVWRQKLIDEILGLTHFLNSGICVTAAEIAALASGPGNVITTPVILEPDFDDEVQKENTAPAINKLNSGRHRAHVLQRVGALGATAISAAMSGADPVGVILKSIARVRLRNRQRTLIANLDGGFAARSAAGAAAALKDLRMDQFSDAVAGIDPDEHLFNQDMFADLTGLYGDRKQLLRSGGIAVHSKIETAMLKQDDIITKVNSEGKIILTHYKGAPVTIDDSLVYTAAGGAKVYLTYLFLPGSVQTGEKPQTSSVGDVSSLVLDGDAAKNNLTLYDRTRFIQHVQGLRWKPEEREDDWTPANSDLAKPENWELGVRDPRAVGVLCLRTNG